MAAWKEEKKIDAEQEKFISIKLIRISTSILLENPVFTSSSINLWSGCLRQLNPMTGSKLFDFTTNTVGKTNVGWTKFNQHTWP